MVKMAKKDNLVIVFAKTPQEGKVKTRLAVDIGDKLACKLARAMLEDTLNNLQTGKSYDIWVNISPACDKKKMERIVKNRAKVVVTPGETVDEQIISAYKEGFSQYERVVITAADTPYIEGEAFDGWFKVLSCGFNALLCLTLDGGACPHGLSTPFLAEAFSENSTRRSDIFVNTLRKILLLGGICFVGPLVVDIDTIADLNLLCSTPRLLEKAPNTYKVGLKVLTNLQGGGNEQVS